MKITLKDTHIYDLWIYVYTNGFVHFYIENSKLGSSELYSALFGTGSARIHANRSRKQIEWNIATSAICKWNDTINCDLLPIIFVIK